MDFLIEGIKIATPRISVVIFPVLILIYVFAVIATTTLGPASYEYYSPEYWRESFEAKLRYGCSKLDNVQNGLVTARLYQFLELICPMTTMEI